MEKKSTCQVVRVDRILDATNLTNLVPHHRIEERIVRF